MDDSLIDCKLAHQDQLKAGDQLGKYHELMSLAAESLSRIRCLEYGVPNHLAPRTDRRPIVARRTF